MNRLVRVVIVASFAMALTTFLGTGISSAHTVSRTADKQTSSALMGNAYPGHCKRRSMSLREKSAGGFQMYGYQAYRLPNCTTSLTDAMNLGNGDDNFALFKLMVWTGSGPYGGFSICRNVATQFPYATGSVSNKFVEYSKGPCGAGMYAAAICTYTNVMWTFVNGQFAYASDGIGTDDCDSPYAGWVWTNDWHYFA